MPMISEVARMPQIMIWLGRARKILKYLLTQKLSGKNALPENIEWIIYSASNDTRISYVYSESEKTEQINYKDERNAKLESCTDSIISDKLILIKNIATDLKSSTGFNNNPSPKKSDKSKNLSVVPSDDLSNSVKEELTEKLFRNYQLNNGKKAAGIENKKEEALTKDEKKLNDAIKLAQSELNDLSEHFQPFSNERSNSVILDATDRQRVVEVNLIRTPAPVDNHFEYRPLA